MKKSESASSLRHEDILSIIRVKNESFASLLDNQLLSLMIEESKIVTFKTENIIVKQHDPSDSLYLILSGRCTVYVNDRLISHIEAGDLLGEMGVIQNTPRSATVIAIEETRALRISADTFKKMLNNPKLATWMLSMLTDRVRRASTDAARFLKEMEEIRMDQMELARVQRSLLPKELPAGSRFRVHVLYSPCAYAGGDYYDAILLDKDHLFLIVADVTGHGAQASISMAIVRSFVHQSNFGKKPETILKKLNRYLFQYGPSQHFVTAQTAVIDLAKKKIHFAYAGHPPMLHLRGDQCQSMKAPRSFFLRFMMDADYKSATLTLNSGDRVAFYTDGVIETFNPDGGMYNMEGLQLYLSKTHKRPVSEVPSLLETDLHNFRNGSPVEDDITFMVVEIA
ncbi:MAG: SpoIIE family protein phosphatase [Candidatus Omnitrophota bacterium]